MNSFRLKAATVAAAITVLAAGTAALAASATKPFLNRFHTITHLSSTVPQSGPAKGDQNPYGVAVVRSTAGKLVKGDVLVSNFNNAKNEQGTGSSIVEVSPSGHARVFAVVPQPTKSKAVGLTTALAALPHGLVAVGSLPAPGGSSANMTAGAVTILSSTGHVVKTLKAKDINGPWDMTAVAHKNHATLLVTNVLNGTVKAAGKTVHKGTVVRIGLELSANGAKVSSNKVIASGFGERTDPNALVVGPTGVGLAPGGTLYVADSVANRIAAIPSALTRKTALGHGGMTVSTGHFLNDPLGLAIAPGGDIVSMNGGDGRAVETTPAGKQSAKTLVKNGAGDLFGLAIAPGGAGVYFVNDAGSGPATNALELLH
jgi:sugar lactone lactonase YvrE